MDKFKTTKQFLIFSIILATASVVSYIIFFNLVKGKNEDVSLITNEIDIAIQKEIKLKSVKDLIKDTENDRKKLDTYFVADDKIVNFIEDVEKIGSDIGVDVEVVSVSISDSKSQVPAHSKISEQLNLDFKVEGMWSDVFQFLAIMEKLPFKIDISKTSLEVVYSDTARKISSGKWKGFFSITVIKTKQ